MDKKLLFILMGLTAFTVVMRLVEHAPNFVPVAALALFAGTYFPKRWGVFFPLVAMGVSDAIIGFYDLRLMAVVYGSFLLIGAAGWWVRRNKTLTTVVIGSVGGAVLFFLATNFAVWAFSDWYPHTVNGLLWCYSVAIPFFKNTLLGDAFYGGIFFGSYELLGYVRRWVARGFAQKRMTSCLPFLARN